MTEHLIDPRLLAIMQCPSCAGDLVEVADPPSLVCTSCALRYPVRDRIPYMRVEDATPSEEA
jgi:uncharacterized protein YbaR (Trm112 family)